MDYWSAARQDAHRLRSQVDAVVVGVVPSFKDNPTLTARLSDRPLKLAPAATITCRA